MTLKKTGPVKRSQECKLLIVRIGYLGDLRLNDG